MFAIMVVTMTLIVAAVIIAWALNPELRRWCEAPKLVMIEREQRFQNAAKHELPAAN